MTTVRGHLGLAVVESQWYDGYSHSVRPLFEFLSYAKKFRTDGFVYERFVGEASFREVIDHVIRERRVKHLYIAAHGEVDRVRLPDGQALTRTKIRNTICLANRGHGRPVIGVYFGSCWFGEDPNLVDVLRDARIANETLRNKMKWAAGYRHDVDFVSGTVLDILFFDAFYRDGRRDEVERLAGAVKHLRKQAKGLMEQLQFSVVVREARDRFRNLVDGSVMRA